MLAIAFFLMWANTLGVLSFKPPHTHFFLSQAQFMNINNWFSPTPWVLWKILHHQNWACMLHKQSLQPVKNRNPSSLSVGIRPQLKLAGWHCTTRLFRMLPHGLHVAINLNASRSIVSVAEGIMTWTSLSGITKQIPSLRGSHVNRWVYVTSNFAGNETKTQHNREKP